MFTLGSLEALGSGIAQSKCTLIYGPSGAGKTTFAFSYLMHGLSVGEHVALVSERAATQVLDQAAAFGLDFTPYLRSGHLLIFEYPVNVAENSARAIGEVIIEEFRVALGDSPVRRVVFDTITPLLGGVDMAAAMARFDRMVYALRSMDIAVFLLASANSSEAIISECKYLVNGVLRFEPVAHQPMQRRLIVERIPDASLVRKPFVFKLVEGVGLVEVAARNGGRAEERAPVVGEVRGNPVSADTPALSSWVTTPAESPELPKILIIHPDPARRAMVRSLFGADAVILESQGLLEALSLLQRDLPDLLLISHETRGALGKEIVARLRQNGYAKPVVQIGGRLRRDADLAAFLDGGVDSVLPEPVDGRVLRSTVLALLRVSGFQGVLPKAGCRSLEPGRNRVNYTDDAQMFTDRVRREVEYCRLNSLPMSVFTLLLPPGRQWLEELATAVHLLVRDTDLIVAGERGVGILLADAESADAFLNRFRLRWKLDVQPIYVPLDPGEADGVGTTILKQLHQHIGLSRPALAGALPPAAPE